MEKYNKNKAPEHPPIFPVVLEVTKPCTIQASAASLVWCFVARGQLRLGTPICFYDPEESSHVGIVHEILKDQAPAEVALEGDRVCIKMKQSTPQESDRDIRSGRLCSQVTRESNATLKESCRSEMLPKDWECLDALNKHFKI